MNRRILIQVTAPAVLCGLILFAACLTAAWSVSRLQSNLSHLLSENVASQEAAQELEIKLRQLRFHSFLYTLDPTAARQEFIRDDQHGFEAALDHAREAAVGDEEKELVRAIATGYQRYRTELSRDGPATRPVPPGDFLKWADAHPVRHLLAPCQRLVQVSKEAMRRTAAESEVVTARTRNTMLLLGLAGPLGGLLGGYGIARALSRSIARLSVHVRDVHAHLDQEVGSVRLSGTAGLREIDQQLERVVSRVQEVAQRLQRQQQEMMRAEQLAAVGQLAASVAHEVRNPLTGMKLLVASALRSGNRKPLTVEDLGVIHGEIVRLEQLVQGLLDFARPPKAERSSCDLREVVAQSLDLVRARAQQCRVALEVSQPAQPVRATIDEGQFRTVLLNLFLNALDAMPQGGRLSVELENGDGIRLEVRDTGPGIAPEMVGRLFTPFASSKPTGTGLGLSICRRAVEDHGGRISAANGPQGGACFTVTLPSGEDEGGREDDTDREGEAPAEPSARGAGGSAGASPSHSPRYRAGEDTNARAAGDR
jgi:signal transduction histidine kinase